MKGKLVASTLPLRSSGFFSRDLLRTLSLRAGETVENLRMAGVNKFLREGAATFRRPASGIQSQLKQNGNRRN